MLVDVLRDQAEQRLGLLHAEACGSLTWVERGRCCGVQVVDGCRLQWIRSRAVVLATAGGHLYTTNPAQAAGEGTPGVLAQPSKI